MKQHRILGGLLALTALSCSVSEADLRNGRSDAEPVFHARMEMPSDAESRVYADPELHVLWDGGDAVSVFNRQTFNREYRFAGEAGAREGDFQPAPDGESGSGAALAHVYAVYPYRPSTRIASDGSLTLELPAVQSYRAGSFGPGANAMVSVTDDNELMFKNICGYLCVWLYGEGTVTSLTFSGNGGEKVAGEATVTAGPDAVPSVAMAGSAGTTLTLDCGEGVELGKTPETATAFWFALPPAGFPKGFTVRINNTEHRAMVKTYSSPFSIERNVRKKMRAAPAAFDQPEAGNVPVGDLQLKALLASTFDTDGDGEVSYAEAEAVTVLDCSSRNITDLGGIECFPALDTLICSNNQLTTLDVSKNTALRYLDCTSNQLTALILAGAPAPSAAPATRADEPAAGDAALTYLNCSNNQLTGLDVSGYPLLQTLYCQNNQLTSLDVSRNPVLGTLFFRSNQIAEIDVRENPLLFYLDCMANRLTALDVSRNPKLETLDFTQNQISRIDVSANPELKVFHFTGNQVTELDLSHNPKLRQLNCGQNPLPALDVTKNPALEKLMCYENGITELDLSQNPRLISFYGRGGRFTSLDFSYNLLLTSAYCRNCPDLTEIWLNPGQTPEGISLSYDASVATIKYKDFPPGNVVFDDAAFKAYCVDTFDADHDGEVSYSEAAAVTVMNCSSKGIGSLAGLEYFTALTELDCSGNKLTGGLVPTNNRALIVLKCFGNHLEFVNIRENPELIVLYCNSNQIANLYLGSNKQLRELSCGWNPLKALDVSNNPELWILQCSHTDIETLDLSKNLKLDGLQCGDGPLAALDVSNNTALRSLFMQRTAIQTLDVSKNTALVNLSVGENQITALDISNNPALTTLNVNKNRISTLDISHNPALTNLTCSYNRLTEVDVSEHPGLTRLVCMGNPLTTLDVSNNLELVRLWCNDTPTLKDIWLHTGQTISDFKYDADVATIRYKE